MNDRTLQPEDLPHYTYDDYSKWEGRWEIIHGIPYAMAPLPKIDHQRISGFIYNQLLEQLKHNERCEVFLPLDWQITEDTVVQPDILVVCGEKVKEKKLETPPVMVFEVLSPPTRRKDKVLKYKLYQNAGVKYYCIVDPEGTGVEVFTLNGDVFREAGELTNGNLTFALEGCPVQLNFPEIFKRL